MSSVVIYLGVLAYLQLLEVFWSSIPKLKAMDAVLVRPHTNTAAKPNQTLSASFGAINDFQAVTQAADDPALQRTTKAATTHSVWVDAIAERNLQHTSSSIPCCDATRRTVVIGRQVQLKDIRIVQLLELGNCTTLWRSLPH